MAMSPLMSCSGNGGSRMKFGLVTYNWGKEWDLPTLMGTMVKSNNTMEPLFLGLVLSLTSLILTGCSDANSIEFSLEIDSSDYISREAPVHVEVTLPVDLQNVPEEELSVTFKSAGGDFENVPGQIIEGENGGYELWWILPEAGKNNPTAWIATVTRDHIANRSTFQ